MPQRKKSTKVSLQKGKGAVTQWLQDKPVLSLFAPLTNLLGLGIKPKRKAPKRK